jgi:hypothetical protein
MLAAAGFAACSGGGSSPSEPPASAGHVEPASFEVVSVSVPAGGTTRVGVPVAVRVKGTASGGAVSIIASLRFFGASTRTNQTVNGPFEVELTVTPQSVGPADAQGRVGHVAGIEFAEGAAATQFFFLPYEMTVLHPSGIVEAIDIPVLPAACDETVPLGTVIQTNLKYSTGDPNRSVRLLVVTADNFQPQGGSFPPVTIPATGVNQTVRAGASVSQPVETRFIQGELLEGSGQGLVPIAVARSGQYPCRIRWQ